MGYTLPSVELQTLLEDMTSGGELDSAKLTLYVAGGPPSRNSQLSDFTTYGANGYTANNPISWGSVGINDAGQAEVLGDMITFLSNGTANLPQNILGYIVTDGNVTKLLYAEAFASNFTLSRLSQQLTLIPRFVLDT